MLTVANILATAKLKGYIKDPDKFYKEAAGVAARIGAGMRTDWLIYIFHFESKVWAQAVNGQSNATGLIQFLRDTAIELGTTIEALYKMTASEQLYYVEKYFKSYVRRGKRFDDFTDTYLCVFTSTGMNKSNDFVIYKSGQKGFSQNKALDIDKNGNITRGDIESKLKTMYPAAYDRLTTAEVGAQLGKPLVIFALAAVTIFGLAYVTSQL